MQQERVQKTHLKRAFLIISVILLCVFGISGKILINLGIFANNQYFSSPAECLEHRFNEEITSTLFAYEGEKQGFFISQNKNSDLIISVLKIKNIDDRKYYHFKESSSAGSINNLIADWYSMGNFEYFIAQDEETILKYGGGKEPTYKETIEYTINDKKEISVVYIIDNSL